MEASGPPPSGFTPSDPAPAEEVPPAPAPAYTEPPKGDKAGPGLRILALVFALVLAFLAAVMIAVAVDIGDTPTCDDAQQILLAGGTIEGNECFDGSSGAKSASVILAWGSGILGAIAALAGLAFVIMGRRGRLVVQLAVGAIVLGVLSILIGSL
jgi:hypothetical protein